MPLARIVTSSPDQFTSLAEYLRSRGYTVETLAPGTSGVTPADLQLDLEGCSGQEAMSRARELADAAQKPARQPIAYDIAGRPVAFADEEEPPVKTGSAFRETWNGLRSAAREMLENLRLSAGHFGEWIDEGRRSIKEHRARSFQARRQAEEEKRGAREAQMRAQAERSRRQEEEAVRARERVAAQSRALEENEEQRRQEREAHERQLLERYRREARRDVVREQFAVEQDRVQPKIAPAEATLGQRIARAALPARSVRDGDWKKAAAAAIALALLATLGYAAYQSRRPAAPLSNRAMVRSQTISQPVPFGPATAPPPQVSTSAQSRRSIARPDPPQARLPQGDAAAMSANQDAARTAPPRKKRHTSRLRDDSVAEDEVIVYHSGTPAARAASAGTTPKHISDLTP